MTYNFDEIISRRHTDCLKYDGCEYIYGTHDILPMWVADMDLKTPDFIIEALQKRIEHPVLGYFYHSEAFYHAIIQWMEKRHQWHIQQKWICFSPGIVSALAVIVQTFTQTGDTVIVQTPVYHPFYQVVENQGRKIIRNPLKIKDDHFEADYEDLENKLKTGIKLMIISNPHNPVGKCWKPEELQKTAELCLKYHCLLVSDEIHSDLMMSGYKHTVTASLSPEIAANTITCMAPSKTFNLAGLSSSEVIISNPVLRQQFKKTIDDSLHINLGNIFGDIALEAAYRCGETWLEELKIYLTENVRYTKTYIAEHFPLLKTYQHEATYLLWVDFTALNISHQELWNTLIHKAKLGFNDGAIFGKEGEKFMRINLACPKSTVTEAMKRLQMIF